MPGRFPVNSKNTDEAAGGDRGAGRVSDLVIRDGSYVAAITVCGGAPRTLTYEDRPLLVAAPGEHDGEFTVMTAGCVLAPWPNRVADGVFAHAGVMHRLAINEAPRANAIHGFVAERRWSVIEHDQKSVVLAIEVGPEPGWPWPLRVTARWNVDAGEGLSGELTVMNLGEEECPAALGWHPYLNAQGAPLNECTLTAPVDRVLPLDPVRNLPIGPAAELATAADGIDSGIAMSGTWLDHCFRAADGPDPTLVGPDGNGVELRAGDACRWYQIFTADPARREGFPGVGRAVAVEPMTCPPNALRSGVDLHYLQMGEELTLDVGVVAICV